MASYADYGDKYLPGEVYRSMGEGGENPFYRLLVSGQKRFKFRPQESTTTDSESFQRFLNLQKNPEALYGEAVKYPKGFIDYMNFTTEFGLNPGAL